MGEIIPSDISLSIEETSLTFFRWL